MLPFVPSLGEFEGWALTGLLGISGAFAFWLRLNKTQTEITKAKTEGGWLTQLVKDRDEAQKNERDAVERERDLHEKYEEVKSENKTLKSEARALNTRITILNKRVDLLTQLVLEFRPDLAVLLKNAAFSEEPDSPIVTIDVSNND